MRAVYIHISDISHISRTHISHIFQYFTKKDVDDLSMSGAYNTNGNGTTAWYDTTPGVECFVGDKALKIDREAKTVISESGRVR